ncbi:MAG: type I 3-dehydroquinate dehydratase, partial [Acidobacteriota bacterium]
MNSGKICISLRAPTVRELVERIKTASGLGDLLELRFDCLEKDELGAEDSDRLKDSMKRILAAGDPERIITTFRPTEYGGCRTISEIERDNFWNGGFETGVADLEEDRVDDSWSWLWGERICSFHDFSGVPDDLDSIFERLAKTKVDIVKIAATVTDATDAIAIWRLLERSRQTRVIPIGMGEAGKWTRVLSLAYGAPITYASPENGSETAPGQISATDLRDVFRVKELDK